MPPLENGYKDDDISVIGQFDGCDISIISSDTDEQVQTSPPKPIPVLISSRRDAQPKPVISKRKLRTVKRSNKSIDALELPSVINLNPRSVYNKVDEFHALVTELSADLIFMSESWERESLTLDPIINLDISLKCYQKDCSCRSLL